MARTVDLAELVRDMEGMLRRLSGADIRFVVRTGEAPCRISPDSSHLQQIILNLVLNAGDAMPRRGCLEIEVVRTHLDRGTNGTPAREYGRLTVRDDGIGMDEQTLAQVFEPFLTTKRKEEGTGLGLSTLYGIVKQTRGRVEVESKLGSGTTFHVDLPCAAAAGATAEVAAVRSHPGVPGRDRILLVEDGDLVRSLIREILEEDGYRVLDARNGAKPSRRSGARARPAPCWSPTSSCPSSAAAPWPTTYAARIPT